MGKTLDKSRDFGTVHGDDSGQGRTFIQDNLYFDGEGNEIPGQTQPAPAAAPAGKAKTDKDAPAK